MRHAEAEIQAAIVSHLRLRAVPNLTWWHTPNGVQLGGKRNKKGVAIQGARLKGLGVRSGVSDIIAVHDGKIFALELKAPGGRPSPSQLEFLADMERAGASVCLAIGVDAAIRALEMWGLLRGTSRGCR